MSISVCVLVKFFVLFLLIMLYVLTLYVIRDFQIINIVIDSSKFLYSIKIKFINDIYKNFLCILHCTFISRSKMRTSLSKFLQPNFPRKSVLSLSNAIIGVTVLSMGYCFQQVIHILVYKE